MMLEVIGENIRVREGDGREGEAVRCIKECNDGVY